MSGDPLVEALGDGTAAKVVNCIGLALNILLFKSVLWIFTGRFIGQGTPDKLHFAFATGVAAVCVALWNFLANRRWTFQAHTPPQPAPELSGS